MKKIILIIILVVVFAIALIMLKNINHSKLVVTKKNTILVVGEKEKTLTVSNDSSGYISQVQKIDEAHKYIQKGDLFLKAGELNQAANEYRKAYLIDNAGSNAVSGSLLVDVYERLGFYREGIEIIDNMIKKKYLSQNGINELTEIRSRLLATIAAAENK